MSHHRTRPDRGWVSPSELPKGPNGRALCRKCGAEVPKGRRTFCSDGCVHEWRIRTDPAYLRRQVELRDRGFCARCRLDTEQLRRQLAEMRDRCMRRDLDPESKRAAYRDFARHREIMARLKLRDGDHLWEADHIVPVVEGGGCCGLEGVRTLCRWCHHEVTAELAARRAEQKRREREGGISAAVQRSGGRPMTEDRNDMVYWWPRLKRTGVPVPRTELITTDVKLISLDDGVIPDGYDVFMADLKAAAETIGSPPFFLRTGHTSGKHDWLRTCYVRDLADLPNHVFALVEFSEVVDFLGLPYRTWAVRELLTLRTAFHAFNGTPINQEFRAFFRDGEICCIHPYWPPDAVYNADRDDWEARLAAISRVEEHEPAIREIVESVMPAFDGAWSLDVCRTLFGAWVAIDMAEMDRSFHWPGCPNDPSVR